MTRLPFPRTAVASFVFAGGLGLGGCIVQKGVPVESVGGDAAAPACRMRRPAWTMWTTWSRMTATRITAPTMMNVQLGSRRHRRGVPSPSW